MPVRRRPSKKRAATTDIVDAWGSIFDLGRDFFGDHVRLGFKTEAAALKAAPAAWRQYGSLHMASSKPMRGPVPWAMQKFGPP